MSVEEKEGKQRNEEIENQLRKDRMSQRNEIKMLLLGKRKTNPTNSSSNSFKVPESRGNQRSSSK